jgi:hypothetical protein
VVQIIDIHLGHQLILKLIMILHIRVVSAAAKGALAREIVSIIVEASSQHRALDGHVAGCSSGRSGSCSAWGWCGLGGLACVAQQAARQAGKAREAAAEAHGHAKAAHNAEVGVSRVAAMHEVCVQLGQQRTEAWDTASE